MSLTDWNKVMPTLTSVSFNNSCPRTFNSFPRDSLYDSSPSSVSSPRSICCARVFDSRAFRTWPRDRTLSNCSLSLGSFKPFETTRSRASDVASRMGNETSASRLNSNGTVVGVTVRLISIQPGGYFKLLE